MSRKKKKKVVDRLWPGTVIRAGALGALDALAPPFGFQDGGCYLFAQCIIDLLEDVPYRLCTVGRVEGQDHVIVEIARDGWAPFYIDSDGISTASEVIKKMEDDWGIRQALIQTFRMEDTLRVTWEMCSPEVMCYQPALSAFLRHRVGALQRPWCPR